MNEFNKLFETAKFLVEKYKLLDIKKLVKKNPEDTNIGKMGIIIGEILSKKIIQENQIMERALTLFAIDKKSAKSLAQELSAIFIKTKRIGRSKENSKINIIKEQNKEKSDAQDIETTDDRYREPIA